MTPNPIPDRIPHESTRPIVVRRAWLGASFLLLGGLLLGGLAPRPAAAEPYLAVRTGMKCSACHVNGSGGGMRTDFGNAYSQTLAPWAIKSSPGGRKVFDPRAGEFISFGGNLRLGNTSRLRPGEDGNGFEITEGELYVQADMVPGFLTFYLDERVAPAGALSREAFVLVRNEAGTLRFKAGKMLLPFGLPLWDDAAATRRVTGFNFTTSDLGVEVGVDRGVYEWRMAVSNGTGGGADNNRAKQVSSTLALVRPHWRVGASASRNPGPDLLRWIWGGYGGFHWRFLDVLGEYDVLRDDPASGEETFGDTHVAYVEGNALLHPGLSLKVAWDWWDPYRDIEEDARTTLRIGLESFVTQFLQLRAFYRWREAPPQLEELDQDSLDFEIHGFF